MNRDLFEIANKVKKSKAYDMDATELLQLCDKAKGGSKELVDAIETAFNFGYSQGFKDKARMTEEAI